MVVETRNGIIVYIVSGMVYSTREQALEALEAEREG